MTTFQPPLGNLVRLEPITLSEIPRHPGIEFHLPPRYTKDPIYNPEPSKLSTVTPDASLGLIRCVDDEHPPLYGFISAILKEADHFVETILPNTFTTVCNSKTSKPAVAKVELLKRMITNEELTEVPWNAGPIPRRGLEKTALWVGMGGEAWFARRSKHANRSTEGTADWPEFDEGLRLDHSEKERQYTPDVYDSHWVLDWDDQTRGLEFEGGWTQVDMRIYEMAHALPLTFKPRVFPVLIITASNPCRANPSDQHPAPLCSIPQHPTSLLVVQIPIDLTTFDRALYSNSRNMNDGDTPQKRKKVVLGSYVSIEKCTMLPNFDIQWVMATASDAKGSIPMWMQKMSVPGKVANDVGLFMKWVKRTRSSD